MVDSHGMETGKSLNPFADVAYGGEVSTKEVSTKGVATKEVALNEGALKTETQALSSSPAAMPETIECKASGVFEKRTADAVIDYSNTADGYVMVKYLKKTSKKLKAQVKGPATTYTYNLKAKKWTVLPLSDGNGSYQVTVFQNTTGSKYASKASVAFQLELKNEFAPFLRPNQYVDFADAVNTVAKAKSLCKKAKTELAKVEKIYNYVVKNITYDKKKAKSVKSGYLPDLDAVLKSKKGICFDYAAVMAGMLRSQGVPTKLVVGYAGEAYHAWISIYIAGEGWIDGVIYFDGKSWQRMDPTFASSAGKSKSIMKYIGDGSNYTAKYFY
ncbi:MAG: transglutaminase domain-containing protein [Firmicutes bacterium]|nr:transglutaminase domain-containing protein [Bacillota bacterium]